MRNLLLPLLVFLSFTAIGQTPADWWYFGQSAGIHFDIRDGARGGHCIILIFKIDPNLGIVVSNHPQMEHFYKCDTQILKLALYLFAITAQMNRVYRAY